MIAGMGAVVVSSPLPSLMKILLLPIRVLYAPDMDLAPTDSFFLFGSTLWRTIILFLSPIFLFVFLFFMGGLTHLFLRLFRGAPRGFAVTLGTFAYSSAPNVIPLIGWAWSGVLFVMGLARAHRTETWRPVAALTVESLFLSLLLLVPILLLAVWFLRTFSAPQGATL